MPDLLHALPANDLGFLRIVAELWGVELSAVEPEEAAAELASALCDMELFEEVLGGLRPEAQTALATLAGGEGGRMTWVTFSRRFGVIREMGAGKRDRERPHLQPHSAAEALFYRALLARAFFETPSGPQEFAYIPDELQEALELIGFVQESPEEQENEKPEEAIPSEPALRTAATGAGSKVLGRPASPGEKASVIAASDRLLDDATTLLAALRMGIQPPEPSIPIATLREFLLAAGILTETGPATEALRAFLEAPRGEALAWLAQAWQRSGRFNELRQVEGLVFEGDWANQALVTREFLLDLLSGLPQGQWWSLGAFVRDLKAQYPDFQRPAGDYDSWFIKRESDGAYLRGFAHWDAVDGALARYLICGPLFWLGRAELAGPETGAAPSAFRLIAAPEQQEEKGRVLVGSNGRISVERLVPRAARYQIARFCEWEAPGLDTPRRGYSTNKDEYRYRATVGSLKAAGEQGLKAGQLLTLLAKHSGGQVPPAFIKALKRWEAQGTEARLEQLTVLRVSRPEVLAELKASPAARFLAEQLGPTAIIVKGGAAPKVLAALAELGLLAEVGFSEGSQA
jgi:hypothetical protein